MEPSVPERGERFARAVHVILVREFQASGGSLSLWATAAGVDRSALGRWVTAYRAPTFSYAARLSLALGLPFAGVVTAAVGLVFGSSKRLQWKPRLRSDTRQFTRVKATIIRHLAQCLRKEVQSAKMSYGISDSEVARRAGVHRTLLIRFASGERSNVMLHVAFQICLVLEKPLDKVLAAKAEA